MSGSKKDMVVCPGLRRVETLLRGNAEPHRRAAKSGSWDEDCEGRLSRTGIVQTYLPEQEEPQ